MDPNDPKKQQSDKEIKDAARKGRSSRPGVIPVNEAAALDQRIAEKSRTASSSINTTAPKELDQLERDVSSKQTNASKVPASAPGAFSSQAERSRRSAHSALSTFESDVAAKQRARDGPASAVEGLDRKVAAKMAAAAQVGNNELRNLEASVQAKMNSAAVGSSRRSSGGDSTREYGHEAPDSMSIPRNELSRLDERIAAKNASAVPRRLQETEDVATKKTNGTLQGTSPQDKGYPEQSPQQAKENGLETIPQELQPHGDVEYGEFGGPTEQGLAIAFAVEEETEDAFIPAAVEYDPDAKPPLIKNRRFRLYAFLAIIVVVVGTISAAVGITLAGKKIEYNISERETSGIREAIEQIVGVGKLDDPSSPHGKALRWIQFDDPLQLLPSNETFIQRFVMVLFYYSTSIKREWAGGCAPPVEGETESCKFKYLQEVFDNSNANANSFVITPWVRWLSGTSECLWAGIQCSEDNHVRSIDLSGTNMTGTIPDEMEQLNFLQSISLKYNELGGPLPAKLVKLRHLVDLNLFGNQLTGTIPDAFFTTPTLQRLNVALNSLNGTISTVIGEMVDAKALFLAFNAFTGTIPTEIGRLQSLVSLWLHRNAFVGTIPTEVGSLLRVEDLLLNRNQLTGTIPTEIGQLTILGDLKFSENKLTGGIPSTLYRLPRLYNLDLFKNDLTGQVDSAIGNVTTLDNLRLHSNHFTGPIPSSLGALKELDNMQVYGNKFNGSMPIELCPSHRSALNLTAIERLVADCLPDTNSTVADLECECCTNCCYTDELGDVRCSMVE